MKVVPIILAGGAGLRLWPLSREKYPKQFLKLVGHNSLIQETVLRTNEIANVTAPIVVCSADHYFLCQDQLNEIEATNARFILEPFGKNTAPALAIAAQYVAQNMLSDSIMLVLPSDHTIAEQGIFVDAIEHAAQITKEGYLTTFGIIPSSPQTGYGYIESGNEVNPRVLEVKQFIEKPNLEKAKQLVADGNFFWNSGMFMFQPRVYLNELRQHSPDIYHTSTNAYLQSEHKDDYLRIDAATFKEVPSNSIDYAVMEKTQKAVVAPLNISWNDLGSWTSVAEAGKLDKDNNVVKGQVLSKNNENCLLSSEDRLIAAMGLKDQIVVSTPDAVLVADKSYAQEVKQLVDQLKSVNSQLTIEHKRAYKPWGYSEHLVKSDNFRVKYLTVKPGCKTSMRDQESCTKQWLVVDGEASITNGEEVLNITPNQSVTIQPSISHQLANPGKEPLHVIEIQLN